ncbi:hypothetical protein V500_09137 [Pseudogymnoascus sp. VKM F-4518 (FW-2643)]|nr:hypothetical protein V500_09137 [Pseudogymnoascus sp. VKM F-4518 (FW-2643)]KFZ19366.1 hypothetical protein V502_03700 [Pseudogymnoascus sp. VKM F-4520 (FW-2644)]
MADLRNGPEQDQEHEGAKPSELIIEACRRNNTELLNSVIEECSSPEAAAKLLNESRSVLGNYAYHEAAANGHYEIIDLLLDQEGFECDPINKREGDTPLHSAVRWVNEQSKENHEYGISLIDMMLEAGSDPKIRNKAKLKAADLVNPANTELRDLLQKAEYVLQNQGDFIDAEEEEDEGPTGSNSDSDFDEEPTNGKKR